MVLSYDVYTYPEKLVADYARINFLEVEELPIDVYLLYMRDAFIYNNSKTKEGREYLEKCWRLEQTKPDKQALRQKFRKEGSNNV